MTQSLQVITLPQLAICLIPVLLVVFIIWRWTERHVNALYALSRMLIQLLLIGHVLLLVFEYENVVITSLILLAMAAISSWIAIRELHQFNWKIYFKVLIAVLMSSGFVLVLVVNFTLQINPWYQPTIMIPLASMVFANAMNALSLAIERFQAEWSRRQDYRQARQIAFHAAMIPITNSLFAVGLVSLPGMMTGQILTGVSPLIAARYQIVVMCILYASSGLSVALYLSMLGVDKHKLPQLK